MGQRRFEIDDHHCVFHGMNDGGVNDAVLASRAVDFHTLLSQYEETSSGNRVVGLFQSSARSKLAHYRQQ